MNCPACGQSLPAGSHERCPFCAALLAPPAEGTLAPNLLPFASTESEAEEPLREIPGLRRRERTWKDEVKERVDDRRRVRTAEGGELPLFQDGEAASGQDQPAEQPAERAQALDGPSAEPGPGPEEWKLEATRLAEPADLPLRSPEPGESGVPAAQPVPVEGASLRKLSLEVAAEAEDDDWSPRATGDADEVPVERPAGAGQRCLAAVLDTLFWASLSAVVLYFAGRIARVSPWELRAAWPYLVGYLVFLGVSYAVYFTGTTGQTLGKMATRLRVVDSQGRPPVYGRALLRALLGSLGIALAALGLVPMAFDPARRALHDRLTRTRVVKSS